MNGIFKLFNSFNLEFSSGNRLVDLFSSCFSFIYSDRKSINSRKLHIRKLNKVVFNTSMNPKSPIIVSDMSIKNNIVTSITHIHTYNSPVIKTIHYTTNIISTEAELFAIRYRINQVVWLPNIKQITIITDSIYTAENIFNSSVHSYQSQTTFIAKDIRFFFEKNHCNFLKFWNCSSQDNWLLHKVIDKETKSFNLTFLFLCKSS